MNQAFARAAVPLLSAAFMPLVAWGQESYPARPVRIVVGFPPGGITDIHARTLAERLAARFRQSFVVENRPGAGGRIGMEAAARAAPDGYTLVVMNGAVISLLPALVTSLPYRPLEDFAPIARTVASCPMVVVHPSVPARSMSELVAVTRERPGQLNLGTPGVGNLAHIQGEQLMKIAGVRLVHVPFKGEADVMRDLIAGEVQLTFAAAVAPQVAAGQVRAIATTCPRRAVMFPDVPTVSEAGFPTLSSSGWQGIGAPMGTPKSIVDALAGAIQIAVGETVVAQRLAAHGLNVDFAGPAEFREFIVRDQQRVKQLIAEFNIKAE